MNEAAGRTFSTSMEKISTRANNELISFFRALKRNIAFPACLFGKIKFLFGKLVKKPLFSSYFFGKIYSLSSSSSSPLRQLFETGSGQVRDRFDRPSPPTEKQSKLTRKNPEAVPCLVRTWYLLVPSL